MPFKDTPEGHTHHGKDACYKCIDCGKHYYRENKFGQCFDCAFVGKPNVPNNAQRTGDEGRVIKFK